MFSVIGMGELVGAGVYRQHLYRLQVYFVVSPCTGHNVPVLILRLLERRASV